MTRRTLVPIVTSVITAAMLVVAWGFPYFQAKLAVIASAGVVLLLGLAQIVVEIRQGEESREGSQARDEEDSGQEARTESSPRDYLREGLWYIAFGVAIYLVGFLVAIPSFSGAYVKAHGTGWRRALTIAVGVTAVTWLLFEALLETHLYPGLLWLRLGLG